MALHQHEHHPEKSEKPKAPKLSRQAHQDVWLPIEALGIVYPKAQRPLKPRKVKELADNFDEGKLDIIHVSLPIKGIHHIIDGQTRIAALLMLGFKPSDKVPCRIHPFDDEENCATTFVELNSKRRAPTAIEEYISRVAGKNPEHIAVDKIVRRAGFVVDQSASMAQGNIRAVAALLQGYRRFGADALEDALDLIWETWDGHPDSVTAMFLLGFCMFCREYENQIDRKHFVPRLQKRFTPGQLTARTREMAKALNASTGIALKRVLEETYDRGLRGKKLKNGKDD